MKSEIIKEQTRTVMHKINAAAKEPTKNVPIFRGLDIKTYKYILSNKYYPDSILNGTDMEFLVGARKLKFAEFQKRQNLIDRLSKNVATA